MITSTTREKLRRRFDALVERLNRADALLLDMPAAAQRRAYSQFEDCLAAAGLAVGLGQPDSVIREWLARAAEVGVEVYRWSHTTLGEITHLPSEETETFIDETLTSPWTFVRVVYTTLDPDRQDLLNELLRLAGKPGHVEGLTTVESMKAFTIGLWRVLIGDLTAARAVLSRAGASTNAENLGEQVWAIQARALLQLVDRDAASLEASLAQLANMWESWYAASDDPLHPERFLVLPVRGLRALAQHRAQLLPH